jgi:hypothetical protein
VEEQEAYMPFGYRTYYGGSYTDLLGQQAQALALEQAMPEGTLVLLELSLPSAPGLDVLADLNNKLLDAGVPPWPGYNSLVFSDSTDPTKIYITWVKGFPWTPVIIGILFLVLPIILGGIIWFLIPESIKNMMIMMGFMMILMPIMSMVTGKEKK